MRNAIFIICLLLFFASCKKDKYTTAPQLKYLSVRPNALDSRDFTPVYPVLTFRVTDAEGDIGYKAGTDTAFIYVKSLLTGFSDSLPFPDLETAGKSNFNAEVDVDLQRFVKCKSLPGTPLHTDTLYFEIYVKDFEKNKSNVIKSEDPVFFTCF
jgi:hypothetical protein